MKLYIAGKITGDPDYRAKFAAAEIGLTLAGHTVLNPTVLPAGLSQGDYLRVCFAMLDCAEAAYFLRDWRDSAGAKLEHDHCIYTGKQTMYQGGGA